MIAAQQIFLGSASAKFPNVVKSMCGVGGSREGFIARGLGTMPMPVTISAWYKCTVWPYYALSKVAFKYGDRAGGVGFGILKSGSNTWGDYYWPAPLVEVKYWAAGGVYSSPTDYGWHHVAFVVKSGSSPLVGTVYIDGEVLGLAVPGGTDAIISPVGIFSICGRDGGGEWEDVAAKMYASRVCIFDGEMSAAAIAADMALGAKAPKSGLLHYYDGTLDNGMLMDLVGNWHLTATSGSTIENETPWS